MQGSLPLRFCEDAHAASFCSHAEAKSHILASSLASVDRTGSSGGDCDTRQFFHLAALDCTRISLLGRCALDFLWHRTFPWKAMGLGVHSLGCAGGFDREWSACQLVAGETWRADSLRVRDFVWRLCLSQCGTLQSAGHAVNGRTCVLFRSAVLPAFV